ncbi:MAG: hypothetical protein CFH37_01344 [Alphaproteobacteria bacterium MarineAlpha9_Bin7]|nr:MAG: hypothetical protein CFH37_01344 [Alphaproteobacteria bacterium MarineAlpha9_Bin7]
MRDGPVEVPETEAAGEIYSLYEDMKAAMNVGIVNLVYRRMATVDGLLEWVWSAFRPALVSGDVERDSMSLKSEFEWPSLPEIPAPALPLLGLGDPEIVAISRVLDNYNRSNSFNLFLFTALVQCLESGGPREELRRVDTLNLSDKLEHLPPIVAMGDMSKETATLIRAMSAPIAPVNKPMIPSLFRHLANWPGFLALVAPHIIHMISSGELPIVSNNVQNSAIRAAHSLSQKMSIPVGLSTPDEITQAYWLDEWRAYISKPIPEMIAIGYALRYALPNA